MASTARHDPGEMRDASCRDRVLVEHRGDFPPAVDPAQLDLPTHHEAEEQGQRRVCPAADASVLARGVERLNRNQQPGRPERDYLPDFPGFERAFGLPIDL